MPGLATVSFTISMRTNLAPVHAENVYLPKMWPTYMDAPHTLLIGVFSPPPPCPANALLTTSFPKRRWMGEAGAALLLGLVVGLIMKAAHVGHTLAESVEFRVSR